MSPFPGPMPLPFPDPCAGPTISSLGTAYVADDNSACSTGPAFGVSITLSDNIPGDWTVQVKAYYGSSTGTYSDSSAWTTVSFSGSSGSGLAFINGVNEYEAVLGSFTRYFNVDVRLVGSDGSTVCDSGSGTEGSSTDWETCA